MFESSVDRLLRLLGVQRAGEQHGAKALGSLDGLFDQMLSGQAKPKPRWAQELDFYRKHGGGDDS
ncbi:hypothetical protein [Bradyrhizobium genosp. P]|uniref:hypothetical protein n=1 Tax=Bradyrhizobium genosp. P TaxID=83641 RepID=UPI003CF9B00B